MSGGSIATVFTTLEKIPAWKRKASRQDFAVSTGQCFDMYALDYEPLIDAYIRSFRQYAEFPVRLQDWFTNFLSLTPRYMAESLWSEQ